MGLRCLGAKLEQRVATGTCPALRFPLCRRSDRLSSASNSAVPWSRSTPACLAGECLGSFGSCKSAGVGFYSPNGTLCLPCETATGTGSATCAPRSDTTERERPSLGANASVAATADEASSVAEGDDSASLVAEGDDPASSAAAELPAACGVVVTNEACLASIIAKVYVRHWLACSARVFLQHGLGMHRRFERCAGVFC